MKEIPASFFEISTDSVSKEKSSKQERSLSQFYAYEFPTKTESGCL